MTFPYDLLWATAWCNSSKICPIAKKLQQDSANVSDYRISYARNSSMVILQIVKRGLSVDSFW